VPDGATHYKYWKRGLAVVIPASGILFVAGIFSNLYVSEFALWLLFWYWCGRYIDPDWDLLGVTQAEGRIQRELDLLAVFILPVTTFYAAGIGYIVKKFHIAHAIGGSHRTWLTHSLVPGTLLRCVLICLCLGSMVNWANFILGHFLNGVLVFYPYDLAAFGLAQFAGLGTADSIHLWLDHHYGGE
jgi:hypothetical protein